MSELLVRDLNELPAFRRHPFPVIDFKFRNAGPGTALLTRYNIEVLKCEVDVTPHLRFSSRLQGIDGDSSRRFFSNDRPASRLIVEAQNFGWGEAVNLFMQIEDEMLLDLFAPQLANDTVRDDARIDVLELDIASLRLDKLVDYSKRQADPNCIQEHRGDLRHARNRKAEAFARKAPLAFMREPFVMIDAIALGWKCNDIKGNSHKGAESVSFEGWESQVLISPDGFFLIEGDYPCAMMMAPGPMFCAMIDVDRAPYIKTYSMSRQIGGGDVERFQVLVGATKSCSVELRISFDVDGVETVRSKTFNLHIENRRDQRLDRMYRDGQEILAHITAKHEAAARAFGPINFADDNW